ncbi:MAG: mechanosensitive ion channel [Chitinophagaceae bacterium]
MLLCLCCSFAAQAQDSATIINRSDSLLSRKDSTSHKDLVTILKELGHKETVNSIQKYQTGRIELRQKQIVEEVRRVIERAKLRLKNGIDTVEINNDLLFIRNTFDVAKDGVLVNKGTRQTQRNLSVSNVILTQLYSEIGHRKKEVDAYASDLVNFRYKIDSLYSDSVLYIFPTDSVSIIKYLKKVVVLAKDLSPVDSAIDKGITSVQELQNKVDMLNFELRSALEEIEVSRSHAASVNLHREFSNIWGPSTYVRPFGEIWSFSIAKNKLALTFFVRENIGRLFIILILVVVATLFLRTIRQRLSHEGLLREDMKGQLVVRYPVLSAILIVLNPFQFIFINPPFIFNFIIWTICAVCLAIIFRNYITRYWMSFWIIMVSLFVLAGMDNLVLQASRPERWIMLLLSLAGAVYGSYILLFGRKHELKEKKILFFIGFVVLLEITSAILNIYGRYNFSKTLMTSGYIGVVVAVLFLWTVWLINEGLRLIALVYKHPERKLLYINFEKVGEKAPWFFYLLLVAGWFVVVGRNFYVYKLIAEPLDDFLANERTIGNYTFTINSVFIFLIILVCSTLLSKIISFFASDTGAGHGGKEKVGLGSWILLLRILIITLGVFLAFAASGIPLDRMTIILGALGVGIGLGLQGLVNNLVSGLIIAFEKPVNVGDTIEINDKGGVMKTIGFRSSVITLFDGSCLIIPNGDLLSQHLVNWTMGRNIKRHILPVSVAYGTDLEKVKTLLKEIMDNHDKIMKYPEPTVVISAFNQSSIALELYFWIKHINFSLSVTSEVHASIDTAFRQAGISIPFPQQDVHVYTAPGDKGGSRES